MYENEQISVIIPVYNARDYLHKCVVSVTNSKYRNLQIVLVDDGSKDGSSEICDELKKTDNRIIVIHKENEGVSIARNLGIKVATGNYILFCDADDYLLPDAIDNIIIEVKKEKADYYVFPLIKETKNGEQEQHYKLENQCVSSREACEVFYQDGNNGPWSKLFNRHILMENDIAFDTKLKIHEDVMFCMQYLEHCSTVKYCETPIYFYSYNLTGAIGKHKIEYLDNYSTVYYLWLSYLKRHRLDRYIGELNCTFLHKMLTTSAKLIKHGMSSDKINKVLNDNQLFNEIKKMHFTGLKWKIEKELLIRKRYALVSFVVK